MKLSNLAKDLRRGSKLTNKEAVALKGGDDRRPRGGSISGGRYGGNSAQTQGVLGSFNVTVKTLGG